MRIGSQIEFAKRLAKPFTRPIEFMSVAYRYTLHTIRLASYGAQRRKQMGVRKLGVMPRTPLPIYTLWGIAQILGLTLVPRQEKNTFLLLDLTVIAPERRRGTEHTYINGTCTDISKTRVAGLFEHVFGRSVTVNPRTFGGLMVEKSETNGVHDGRIIRGPLLSPETHHSYQRLVDNRTPDNKHVEDLRIVVVGNTLPLVYRKRRLVTRRFESSSIIASIESPAESFSEIEQKQLKEFSRELGMEFGELDVLRDRDDGKIYVVDANKTSISPPISMSYEKRLHALTLTAQAFEKEFLRS